MPAPCPLCGLDTHMKKPRQLYGWPVCKKCVGKFANRRQLAFIADIFCLRLAGLAIGLGVGLTAASMQISEAAFGAILVLMQGGEIGVLLLRDAVGGVSPGKLLTGLQTVDRDTAAPIGITASMKRNLPLLVPLLPLVAAVQLMKGPRIGDKWSRSKVIWKKYADHPLFSGAAPEDQSGAAQAAVVAAPAPVEDNNPYRSPQW